MSDTSRSSANSCSLQCNSQYQQCIGSGEHESVCRMKRVPCDCRCEQG